MAWWPEILDRCAGLEGASVSDSMFGAGPAVWVGKREVAHAEESGVVDVRLTKAVIRRRRAELRQDRRVTLRASSSDWIEIRLGDRSDQEWVWELIAEAVSANRPHAPAGPPPTGAELERRRRFH